MKLRGFKDHLRERLKDPEFKKIYDSIKVPKPRIRKKKK